MNRGKLIIANLMRWLTLITGVICLTGCSGNWGWYVISPATDQGIINIKFLLGGLKFTILLSVTAIVVAVVLGLLIALPGISKNRLAKGINWTYVELIRAIPLLVMILWVYYGLPQVAGISISAFAAGVLALAISDSAFQAEIFRAGIQSIDRGQIEAANALGLTYYHRMRFIVLPQAIRRILPPLGNQLIYMLKMSSLISIIGMQELTRLSLIHI